jgi:4a-hydroxytetrahydrobiopterin dehydratase
MKLTEKKCVPCEGGVPKLTAPEIEQFSSEFEAPWEVVDEMKIVKQFSFNSYPETIAFVNKVAELSEKEDHHPVMHVYFSKLKIELWTHAILGLSENDFILAAKIDELY